MLTVHDSVICQARYAPLVKDKMWTYFTELVDQTMNCRIKYIKYTPIPNSITQNALLPLLSRYIPPPAYKQYTELLTRYKPTTEMKDYIFGIDKVINIGTDTRSNKCNLSCKHRTRVLNYIAGSRSFRGAIKVKLDSVGGVNTVLVQ